jgi:hypothetical protein
MQCMLPFLSTWQTWTLSCCFLLWALQLSPHMGYAALVHGTHEIVRKQGK